MNLRLKRLLAARLLLSVFVPMLLMASLHVHPVGARATDGDCYECANHLAHGGHLQTAQLSVDDCVLCQFSAASFVAVAVAVLTLPAAVFLGRTASADSCVCLRCVGMRQRRAPPFLFLA